MNDTFVRLKDVSYVYDEDLPTEVLALRGLSLTVRRGSHVAILGRNGSGKSTVARLIDALLIASEGLVEVDGIEPLDDESIYAIRRRCGMVFQNPDNQIVGTTVEEDVAFGPENIGMETGRMHRVVREALETVGLAELASRAPSDLSGGQKQKLAIAGALAMRPRCLILDEATAMLDPESQREFLQLVCELQKNVGLTVINITHNMEEVLLADYVYVLGDGSVQLEGSPADVFDRSEIIRGLGLDVPRHIEIAARVAALTEQPLRPHEAYTFRDAVVAVTGRLQPLPDSLHRKLAFAAEPVKRSVARTMGDPIVTVQGLSHTYGEGKEAVKSLDDVTFSVRQGELLGIVGHSGSGKSTLIQHLNGLLRPPAGVVRVRGYDASDKHDIRLIRRELGLLFQYPEHQLFEETVELDIAFGLSRQKLLPEEVALRVREAASRVGVEEALLQRSPFELSGGQKRRVAIAGVLVMRPRILVFDEPAAGLDPQGRDEILADLCQLGDGETTVLIVSHNMDDISRFADRLLVLKKGRVHQLGTPAEVFADEVRLQQAGLEVPRTTRFLEALRRTWPGLSTAVYEPGEAAREILRAAGEASHGA